MTSHRITDSMHAAFITSGMSSPLNSSLVLAQRLTRRGHRVSYLGPRTAEDGVRNSGHSFIPLVEDRALQERWELASSDTERAEIRQESIRNDEVERTLKEIGAEVLLIEIELHHAIIVTRGLELPTLLTTAWFPPFRSPGIPPMNTSQPLPAGLLGRLRAGLSWEKIWARSWRSEIMRTFRRQSNRARLRPVSYVTRDISDIRDLARDRGWDLSRNTTRRHWMLPHSYRGLAVFSFTAREMDFPGNSHPLAHYVGPVTDPTRVEPLPPDARRTWETFLASIGDSPLIYCSLGSYWETDLLLLEAVIGAGRRREDWALVIGLGGRARVESLGELPPNVLALEWAPQLEAIARSSVVVTHGGITTINESVMNDVPVLVYSTGHVDQDGCAARIAFHGLGISADRSMADAESVELGIQTLLEDHSIRQNVVEMRCQGQRYIDEQVAERLVENAHGLGVVPRD